MCIRDRLWGYDRVILTPHVSGNYNQQSTYDTVIAMAVENLQRYLDKQPLKYRVDRKSGYRVSNKMGIRDRITQYLMQISKENLSDKEMADLNLKLQVIKNLERIGDLTVNLVEFFEMVSEDQSSFSVCLLYTSDPAYPVISTMMLRSMQKAKYDPRCLGHFGLALEEYTHFTSPIRRYPDLIVHRMLHKYGFGTALDPEMMTQDELTMEEYGKLTSERERAAIEAEREVEDMKKAEYMDCLLYTSRCV